MKKKSKKNYGTLLTTASNHCAVLNHGYKCGRFFLKGTFYSDNDRCDFLKSNA
jgi:hypothetical protein